MGWEVGGSFRRERTYVSLWLIHVVRQKPTRHCKAVTLQLNFKEKNRWGNVSREKEILSNNKKDILEMETDGITSLMGLLTQWTPEERISESEDI